MYTNCWNSQDLFQLYTEISNWKHVFVIFKCYLFLIPTFEFMYNFNAPAFLLKKKKLKDK